MQELKGRFFTERAGASKLARKSKDAGTPDIKGMSPVALAGQNGTDAHPNSPLIAASLIDGEMKLLRINPEELKSVSGAFEYFIDIAVISHQSSLPSQS